MRLTEKDGKLFLYDIHSEDIRFANLAGRKTNSRYSDSNNPKHEYVVWVNDPEILDAFKAMNVRIGELINPETNEVERCSVRFKAYPKMKINKFSGKEYQSPMVILQNDDDDSGRMLSKDEFKFVDTNKIESVSIQFHLYKYDDNKPDCIPTIDKLFCRLDPEAGFIDSRFLEEMYGYIDQDAAPDEGEALPFN